MDSNVDAKEQLSYVSKNCRVETTNPSEKSEKLLDMMQTSQRWDKCLDWSLGMLRVVVILSLLHHWNIKIDAITIIETLAGNEVITLSSNELKKWRSDKAQ